MIDDYSAVAGEFRYKFASASMIDKGTLTAAFKIEGSYAVGDSFNAAYITLFGTSGANDDAYLT